MKKKEIREVVPINKIKGFHPDNYSIFEGSLEEVVNNLIFVKDYYKNKYKEIILEWMTNYDNSWLEFYGTRKETDREYERRINKNKKQKELKNKRAKEKLEKLIKENPKIAK